MTLKRKISIESPLPRQRGQAMALTLAFGAATALITLYLFNSGQLVNAKTRMQNAADAGAYSAAILQARDHNFSAYTNRSMIANQAAVAQIVSMDSVLEDAADTRERMDGWLLQAQELIPVSEPIYDGAKSIPIKSVESAFSSIASPAVKGLDLLIRAHEAAQEAHHLATALDMVLVADEVVKKNDPGAEVSTGGFTVARTAFQVKNWAGSTKRHAANDDSAEADRFADVVVSNRTTDGFTRNRTSVPIPSWNSDVSFCLLAGPFFVSSQTVFGFAHAGGTQLSRDKKRWLALDATMGTGFQTCTVWYPCFFGVCYATETTPLIDLGGSGGAVAGKNGDYDSQTGYKNNPGTTAGYGLALYVPPPAIPAWVRYGWTGPGSTLDEAGGLQDYYRDVAAPGDDTPENQSPELNGGKFPITLEVKRKGENIRTSSRVLPGNEKLYMADAMKGDSLVVLSSASSYFYRPKDHANLLRGGWSRSDDKTEMQNLFSPYWQARLVDRTTAERALSWSLQ